nr:acyltransferase [Modestobacter marinus]
MVRAVALLVVVLGHWTAVVVVVRDGRLTGSNALGSWPPAEWLSWLLQVMPLFFLVGGYAGMASWQSARDRGRTTPGWLADRLDRLLRPTTLFLLAVLAATALAGPLVGGPVVGTAAWLVALPLWFLAVYVVVVAATPLLVAAHRRWGLRVPLGLALAVVASDGLRLLSGEDLAGAANYVLVWLCLYALGMAWRTGTLLAHHRAPAALLAGGGSVAVGLVALGPWPLAMLGVPGDPFSNTAPPTLALLAHGVAQAGLVLLLRDRLAGLCRRPAVWAATAAVNATALTLYLWHLVPVLVAAPALYLTGVLPSPEPLTAGWFALRPLWLLACALVLVALVVVVGGAERRTGDRSRAARQPPGTALRGASASLGIGLVCVGLVLLTAAGPERVSRPAVLLTTAACYAAGLVVLRHALRPGRRSRNWFSRVPLR